MGNERRCGEDAQGEPTIEILLLTPAKPSPFFLFFLLFLCYWTFCFRIRGGLCMLKAFGIRPKGSVRRVDACKSSLITSKLASLGLKWALMGLAQAAAGWCRSPCKRRGQQRLVFLG